MVNENGQSVTEYILMMAVMTLIGVWIMKGMTGTNLTGNSGALAKMSKGAAINIAKDERP